MLPGMNRARGFPSVPQTSDGNGEPHYEQQVGDWPNEIA